MKLLFLTAVALNGCAAFDVGSRPAARPLRSPATQLAIDPRDAPGDPSLILTTNVALNDKAGFISAASAAVAEALSKPETYVRVTSANNMCCIADDL